MTSIDYSTVRIVYAYATDRDDGFAFAVGVSMFDAPANGSVALFADREDLIVFVEAIHEKHGVPFILLPSVENYSV